MNRVIALERDDDIVRELLAPFERVQPVSLRRVRARADLAPCCSRLRRQASRCWPSRASPLPVRSDSARCTALPSAPTRLRSLPGATNTLACNLIGQTAGQAETALHQKGYQIEWRFQTWGSQPVQNTDKNAPGGVNAATQASRRPCPQTASSGTSAQIPAPPTRSSSSSRPRTTPTRRH